MDHKPQVAQATQQAAEHLGDSLNAVIQEFKPRLRGWLHAITSPLTLAAGIVLIALSPTAATRVGSGIFAASALLLFTMSAVYHRGTWSPRTWNVLRRVDHANIFLLIAGIYTPFCLVMLEGSARVTMLSIAWGGAILGVLFRVLWLGAPRWLYIPIYVALGWAAVFYADDFIEGGSLVVFVLICLGGALYTIGGLVYAVKRPNPFPDWFGFHEVFHTFTILAFAAHYAGVSIATYSLR